MENAKIYDFIKKIAEEQKKNNEAVSRSDVAFMIQDKFKITCPDGAGLSKIIYDAYLHCGKNDSIRQMIVSNNDGASIVEQYEMNALWDENRKSEAVELLKKSLDESEILINDAREKAVNAVKLEMAKEAATIYQKLQATEAIERMKEDGANLMQNYGRMVDSYLSAENSVKNSVHDFVELRSAIHSVFLQYASALMDVFGDSIKVVAPDLFDFENIKWLDVVNMHKQKQLEFNKLDEKCTLLIGDIAQHFKQTVDQLPVWMKASKAIGAKGGIYGTLLMGIVSYLNHWMDAKEKSVRMQKEFVAFKDGIRRDSHQITVDMTRLTTIHKTLNDLSIPQADAFVRHGEKVLSDDLNKLLDSIYTDETKKLKEERDDVLKKMKQLEQSINDHSENIAIFNAQIEDWQGMLNAQKSNYDKAVSSKPVEPNALTRFITFGIAKRNYGRKFLEWDEHNGELVNAYEDTIMDVKEGQEDLENHTVQMEKDKKEYEICQKRLNELRKEISQKLTCDTAKKAEVLTHLSNVVSLLHVGKKIIETRLDDSLMDVQRITTLHDAVALPSEIEDRLKSFSAEVCSEIQKSGGTIAKNVLDELGIDDNTIYGETGEEMAKAVEKVGGLLKNWSYLQTEQMKSQLNDAVYNEEMEKIKKEFKATMDRIDKKSAVMTESLKKANTAMNSDELRKALVDLAGVAETHLNESDLTAILRGEKSLEI